MSDPMTQSQSQEVFDCVMNQNWGLAGGLAVGVALSLRRKKMHYFLAGSTMGAGLDIVYARTVKCKDMIDAFMKTREALDAQKGR